MIVSPLDSRTGTGACPYDGALPSILLPKWHGRDNPLWLSCIRTGMGVRFYGRKILRPYG